MILIIGIGNPLRQDDGAGHALAARLAEAFASLDCACCVLQVQQLAPEHAVAIASAEVKAVCFVDVAVDAPGLRLTALDPMPIAAEPARLSHEIDARTLLMYAGILRTAVPSAWLLTVGGSEFDHGEGLSAGVTAALADAGPLVAFAHRICDSLGVHTTGPRTA